jgi:hypothetical protein
MHVPLNRTRYSYNPASHLVNVLAELRQLILLNTKCDVRRDIESHIYICFVSILTAFVV